MNRLRRFNETLPYEVKSARIAYAIDSAALPEPLPDATWIEDVVFSAAEAVLSDPRLKPVYLMAIEKGCAIVAPPLAESLSKQTRS